MRSGRASGLLYLRGEYEYLLAPLQAVLARRRGAGLLGAGICGQSGFDFDIAIHLGAGAYVCGEESALIESLEGKRGMPRNRPPYPVTQRLSEAADRRQQRRDLLRGRADRGARRRVVPGASARPLGGHARSCRCPATARGPASTSTRSASTVREVLADCGAERHAGGAGERASGICIDETEFDRRIAFEDLPTAGAFMVFDESRDMFEVARNFVHFFAHESCGFCTPCRVGTTLLRKLMDKLADGNGSQHDLAQIVRLNQLLQACQPLRARAHRVQPGARHAQALPPGLRAAAACRSSSSRRSTSTARWRGRGR